MDSQDKGTKATALVTSTKPLYQQGDIWIKSLCHSLLKKVHVFPAFNNNRRNHVAPLLYPLPPPLPPRRKLVVEAEDASTSARADASPISITEPEHHTPLLVPATKHNGSDRSPLSSSSPTKILKRLMRTTSVSEISAQAQSRYSGLAKLHRKQVEIYLKAPYFVTGGKLAGTVVVNFPAGLVQPDLLDAFQKFVLHLRGVESVAEPGNFAAATHTFQFLDKPVLCLGQDGLVSRFGNHGRFVIPFVTEFPQELGGSYKDKKGSVRYQLQVEVHLAWPEDAHGVDPQQKKRTRRKTICRERLIQIYTNARTGILADSSLYLPVHQTRQVWSAPPSPTNSSVQLDLSLPRSLWVTETPIYVHLKLSNTSIHTITDIKLELLRRQNTFSQTGLEGSFGLKPVTSTCETVAEVMASTMGWLLPIEYGMDDQATMVLLSPKDHFTVRSHKLIDVSYSIRLSLVSSTTNSADAVMEVPVMLVHPISLDPPPGNDDMPAMTPRFQHLFHTTRSTLLLSSSTPSPWQQHTASVGAFRKVRSWVKSCQSFQFPASSKRDIYSLASPPISLPSFPPTTQLQGLPSRWLAPSEKFELGSTDLIYHPQQQRHRLLLLLPSIKRSYPRAAAARLKKRVLASSRYLKSLQNKALSRAAGARKLLALQANRNDTRKEVNPLTDNNN